MIDPRAPFGNEKGLVARIVGARIRELRGDAEVSQAELARRIGTHRPIMSRIERGIHEPSLETCERVAAALDLDVATLLVCLDDEWRAADRKVSTGDFLAFRAEHLEQA